MHIVEEARYKVSCRVERIDLKAYGIVMEDLLNRTPLGNLFIRKAAELAKASTDYEWPGCAMSMQMDFYRDSLVLIFSERLDDYLYNLRQSLSALPREQADNLDKMITMISMAEEEEARGIIREFEQNVKNI
ncbi:MAG: adaptor protein MecA [Bacteroidales bacterium]|nr:adaptor protein MecA [Clostridium sp.]MCM1203172.1 adaptor protein MecA [Bacteroidales bacterium]